MLPTPKQLALIHVAKTQLGLADDDYRALLIRVAGVSSSRDLTHVAVDAVMTEFRRLGFTAGPQRQTFGRRVGMASPSQIELIRDLFGEYKGRRQNDAALGKWLERFFHVSSIRFLSDGDARRVIGALKTMKSRRNQSDSPDAVA